MREAPADEEETPIHRRKLVIADPTMSLPNIKTRSSFAPSDVESPREVELHEIDDSVNDASDEIPGRQSRTSNREFRSETRLSKAKTCDH